MIRLAVLLFLFLQLNAYGQSFIEVTPLSAQLGESSGLLFLNGKIITHTDSQGEAALYEVDSLNGDPSRKVVIANASNIDWEDITADSTYIYIGDFGNNNGNRTNLRIYRITQNDYWNTPNDTVFADTIHFSFADQTNFTYAPEASNYDCEAIASINDSLYLFTKNWVNAKTYVYSLPKNPGTYAAPKIDSIFVQGLITGADYHAPSDRLTLCGYTQFPFIVEMNQPMVAPFGQNPFLRYNIPGTSLIQLEAIAAFSDNNYYLTAETFQAIAVRLYRLSGNSGIVGTSYPVKFNFSIFPNPSDGHFTVRFGGYLENAKLNIFTLNGEKVVSKRDVSGTFIDIHEKLTARNYILQIEAKGISIHEMIVIK